MKTRTKAFDTAIRLLSRREHAAKELVEKLQRKGFNPTDSLDALSSCQELDLQNDQRFVDMYCRSRMRQGYGPLKIAQELQLKGISQELIERGLQSENWFHCAWEVWNKKTKNQEQMTFSELQKNQRFLQYRGFNVDTITALIRELKNNNNLVIDQILS